MELWFTFCLQTVQIYTLPLTSFDRQFQSCSQASQIPLLDPKARNSGWDR